MAPASAVDTGGDVTHRFFFFKLTVSVVAQFLFVPFKALFFPPMTGCCALIYKALILLRCSLLRRPFLYYYYYAFFLMCAISNKTR